MPGTSAAIGSSGSAKQEHWLTARLKRAASGSNVVGRKLLWSTGKAAWIAGTTFLILCVPLIIEMDREQQLMDLEGQQGLLGAPPVGALAPPAAAAK
ncbi:hypothetical protein CLOM_g5224 [Closterium sp. NIES-68]|nr:hypothetical protein CLOM_g5224 [Closterium sp. NIES-68]